MYSTSLNFYRSSCLCSQFLSLRPSRVGKQPFLPLLASPSTSPVNLPSLPFLSLPFLFLPCLFSLPPSASRVCAVVNRLMTLTLRGSSTQEGFFPFSAGIFLYRFTTLTLTGNSSPEGRRSFTSYAPRSCSGGERKKVKRLGAAHARTHAHTLIHHPIPHPVPQEFVLGPGGSKLQVQIRSHLDGGLEEDILLSHLEVALGELLRDVFGGYRAIHLLFVVDVPLDCEVEP